MKIEIEIPNDDVPFYVAAICVDKVIKQGRISKGRDRNGKERDFFCWCTILTTPDGEIRVNTKNRCSSDRFVVTKEKTERI